MKEKSTGTKSEIENNERLFGTLFLFSQKRKPVLKEKRDIKNLGGNKKK